MNDHYKQIWIIWKKQIGYENSWYPFTAYADIEEAERDLDTFHTGYPKGTVRFKIVSAEAKLP